MIIKSMETKEKIAKKPNIGKYLKRYKMPIFLYIFITILTGVGDVFRAIILANAVEKITINDFHMATIMLWIVLAISLFQRVGYYLLNYIYYKYSNKIMSDLNLDLAKQAFKLNSKTYNDHDTGTFVQRIVEDPARIVDSMATIVDVTMEMLTAFIMIIYIATLNLWISLVLISLLIIGFILEYYRVKIRRKNRYIVRRKNDEINSLTTEIVRSEKDIKSLGLEEELSQVSKERYKSYQNARYKMDMTDVNFWQVRNFLINTVTILILIMGVWLMNMDMGLLSMATFMIIYSNNGSIYSLVNGFREVTNSYVDIKVSHSRMFSLFDEDEFITENFGSETVDHIVGEIEFKDVSFTFKEYEYQKPETLNMLKKHGNRLNKKLISENQIFKNLSFKIKPNTTVAFVGKSGSGKSTILNLMSKMFEADDGEILIDGHNIKELDKETLRKNISLVNQFPYIFDMTIKENLLLAKGDATEEDIENAIKKSSLDEFVSTLPKGIETRVGESGIKLSGGQKQRLAIARAFLRNSPIIIFDESTSSLDNFAQGDIKKSIDTLKGHSTIIIVAHRLSTIKNVDKIFFLDNGQIQDIGTFDELFKRNESFKSMFLAENI